MPGPLRLCLNEDCTVTLYASRDGACGGCGVVGILIKPPAQGNGRPPPVPPKSDD